MIAVTVIVVAAVFRGGRLVVHHRLGSCHAAGQQHRYSLSRAAADLKFCH